LLVAPIQLKATGELERFRHSKDCDAVPGYEPPGDFPWSGRSHAEGLKDRSADVGPFEGRDRTTGERMFSPGKSCGLSDIRSYRVMPEQTISETFLHFIDPSGRRTSHSARLAKGLGTLASIVLERCGQTCNGHRIERVVLGFRLQEHAAIGKSKLRQWSPHRSAVENFSIVGSKTIPGWSTHDQDFPRAGSQPEGRSVSHRVRHPTPGYIGWILTLRGFGLPTVASKSPTANTRQSFKSAVALKIAAPPFLLLRTTC